MATERVVIPGIIKDGLVVPQGPVPLPEGSQVGIIISGPDWSRNGAPSSTHGNGPVTRPGADRPVGAGGGLVTVGEIHWIELRPAPATNRAAEARDHRPGPRPLRDSCPSSSSSR